MENQEFQKHILTRIQKLEEKSFGATFEEKYSPREQAEKISDEQSQEHFIGTRTRESALQRVIAFGENYDDGAINSLHGNEIIKFHKEKATVEMLIAKYNIREDETK